jgi:exodeoxyribonuclease X
MIRLRVIDLETTGMAPPSEIVEFGKVDVEADEDAINVTLPTTALFRPLGAIPPETMAVHHITELDIPADARPCNRRELEAAVWQDPAPNVFVAHNCEFEQRFIGEDITRGLPWICTYKVAMHVWPDSPKHSNQVLRYWRGMRLDPAFAMPPHRAGPDAWVTGHLLAEMLRLATVEQMIEWTRQPRPMPVIPFGMHRGLPWAEIPIDYLDWMVAQVDMDADAVWHARWELGRRRNL